MMIRLSIGILLALTFSQATADCVEGALNKTGFSRLNNHTVALTGGYGSPIVIKTNCKIKRNSTVAILKDSFCSASEAVLFVDGEECGADHVSESDKISDNKLYDDDNSWDDKVD